MRLALFLAAGLMLAAGPASAGFDEGVAAFDEGDYRTALKEFRAAAAEGHPKAQFNLGLMHYRGLGGLEPDPVLAAGWTRKAADQGYALAQFTLGQMYLNGLGVGRDYEAGARYLRRAADQGHAQAMNNLAGLYAQGWGVPPDAIEAYVLYSRAVEGLEGEAKAMAEKNRAALAENMSKKKLSTAKALLAVAGEDTPPADAP